MTGHCNDNKKALNTFLMEVADSLRASFKSSKVHGRGARDILREVIRHNNVSAHEDHVNETRYNVAWRDWAMICDLAEKLWLHYQGTFDKMLALLTTDSGPATSLTSAFDKILSTAPMTTHHVVNDEDGRSVMKSQLTIGSKLPKHRAEDIITGGGEVTINHTIYGHFLTLLKSDTVMGSVGCDFYIPDDDAMGYTRHYVSALDLLDPTAMSDEHSDLQNVFGYQNHDDVNVLFETTAHVGVTTLTNQLYRHILQRMLDKLPVSPNDGSTNASRGDPNSGPIIPGFPTALVTQNAAYTKAKGNNTKPSSKSKYKSDSEASGSDDEKQGGGKQPQRKKRKVGDTTIGSDAGAKTPREKGGPSGARPSGAPSSARMVNRGPFGLSWYRNTDEAMHSLEGAYTSFVEDENSMYLRVTLLPLNPPPKSGVTSFVVFIPVLLSSFRENLRKQARSSAKFPGPEFSTFTMGQPLLRHGVHVHSGGGGSGSCVTLYAKKQFVTFSNDGLQSVVSKGVDWSTTTSPLTFQVLNVDKRVHSDTECLNRDTRVSRKLPTVLDVGFYAYLSEHVMSTPTQLSGDDQQILDGHLSMEKR